MIPAFSELKVSGGQGGVVPSEGKDDHHHKTRCTRVVG